MWSNNEICSGDSKIVFELLDDIWHFYSNKNFDNIIRSKSKLKESSFSSCNINDTNFQPVKNNLQIKENSNSYNKITKDNKRKENSANSISLNNNCQKRGSKHLGIKNMNIFSPICKHDEERENKNIYQNTNSDILNCFIVENDLKLNNKNLIKRGMCLKKLI